MISLASVFICVVARIQSNTERKVENDGGGGGKGRANRVAAHSHDLEVAHLIVSSEWLPMVAETPFHPGSSKEGCCPGDRWQAGRKSFQGRSGHTRKGRADRGAEPDQTTPETHFTGARKSPLLLGFLLPEPDRTLIAPSSFPFLFSPFPLLIPPSLCIWPLCTLNALPLCTPGANLIILQYPSP